MGRKKGGAGRGHNAPDIYTGTSGSQQPTANLSSLGLMPEKAEHINLQSFAASEGGAAKDLAAAGTLSQSADCENEIELWLSTLRDFLEQFQRLGNTFCTEHDLQFEIAIQLEHSITKLLGYERHHIDLAELTQLYQRIQQILLTKNSKI